MHNKINIAIDGLSSTGKSTLARCLAKELGFTYIDSGAMYRAITLYFLQKQIEFTGKDKNLKDVLRKVDLKFIGQRMHLNKVDVEEDIRTMEVSGSVSEVAALPVIRDFCVEQQKEYGKSKGVVMDGRDIGTIVFPDAELKIFLCASEAVRITRRHEELKAKGSKISIGEVKSNLLHRDKIDSTREYNPLTKATDARELDNSSLDIKGQINIIKNWIEELA